MTPTAESKPKRIVSTREKLARKVAKETAMGAVADETLCEECNLYQNQEPPESCSSWEHAAVFLAFYVLGEPIG